MVPFGPRLVLRTSCNPLAPLMFSCSAWAALATSAFGFSDFTAAITTQINESNTCTRVAFVMRMRQRSSIILNWGMAIMALGQLLRRSGAMFLSLALVSWNLLEVSSAYEVVYAVNCGGPSHKDRNGIKYSRDTNKVGIASDFGKTMIISRVSPEDQILYQTERYHTSHFSYDVPINSDGEYTLVLKFAEVYFQWVNGKVRRWREGETERDRDREREREREICVICGSLIPFSQ